MTENKRFIVDDAGTLIDMQTRDTFDYVSDVCGLLNELHEENQQMKSNGLNVLHFYENKLKSSKRKDFQSIRDEIWIVKQVLYEMGILK